MLFQISAHTANILRFLAVSEIAFVIGFLSYRVWKKRHSADHYLLQMAIGLVLFAGFVAIELGLRYGAPLSWRTPYAFVASTITLAAVIREGWHSGDWKQRKEDEINN